MRCQTYVYDRAETDSYFPYQLQDAERELEEARQASREHVTSCHRRVQQFNKQQADIDRRLLIFTRSDTSDDAIRQFEATMDKLRNFDVATGYFELLRAVDKLRSVGPASR